MDEKFDFIAIGDITTDAFIKLKEAKVNCDINKENCQICLRFGDKIPYESVTIVPAVGNSPNAAVAAARLGLKSAVVTNVGGDHDGKEAIGTLEKNGVDTRFVKINEDKKTNYHYVLWYGAERTILIKHEEFDYALPDIGAPSWVYLSSLGENSLDFHHQLSAWLNDHPETKLSFQPGTFQIGLGPEKLSPIFNQSEIFFCNLEEARQILKTPGEKEIKILLTGIHALGPKIVVLTDGPNGAYTFDGTETWHMPIYPDPKAPVDRTGAGDSFSSTFTAMLSQNMSIPEALRRAPINSMSVVQHVGAQTGLLSQDQLENYLIQAPTSYQPEKLS
jgi:sugar/nucleoside kinase (ribokinase family)